MTRALIVIQTDADRDRAARWARGVPVGSRIEFKETKRSLPQNDRFWAMLTDIAAHMKKLGRDYSTDQWKAIFMHACGKEVSFLPSLDGKTFIPWGQSSSDLSKQEMTDMIEFMFAWGAENAVVFKDPKSDNSNPGEESPSASPVDDVAPSAASAGEDDPLPSSPAQISDDERAWLLTVARMLWACTPETPSEETLVVLNNQRLAAGEFKPDPLGDETRNKAGSIYKRCKECVEGKHLRTDTLKYIAGVAGCDVSEIGA